MQMEVSEGQEKLRALFEDQQHYRAQAARAEKSSEGLATQVQELRLKCISKSGHSSA
jgi:ribosomal protein L29